MSPDGTPAADGVLLALSFKPIPERVLALKEDAHTHVCLDLSEIPLAALGVVTIEHRAQEFKANRWGPVSGRNEARTFGGCNLATLRG